MRTFLVLSAVSCAVLLAHGEASAFCRSTTCTCKKDAPLLEPGGQEQQRNAKGVPQTTCGQPDGECPRDDDGCQTRGLPTAWTGGCVGFSANLAGTTQLSADEYDAAFDAAFQAWALADCGGGRHPSIKAFKLRPTTCGASHYDPDGPNINTIYFTDDGWTDYKQTRELDAIIARTKTNFDHAGVILDADVAINSARHDFTVSSDPGAVAYDLVSVLTHEAGHFYGIDHSSDPSAVMYYAYAPGSLRRELQPDDVAAICTIYPPDRVTTCDPTPRGGLEDTCGPKPNVGACSIAPSDSGPTVGISMLGLTILWAKRRRRR